MADFRLDTSGVVIVNGLPIRWDAAAHEPPGSGLSPFEQGYVEGMPWDELAREAYGQFGDQQGFTPPGFSDLHPETLAAIRKDCAAFRDAWPLTPAQERPTGAGFWQARQAQVPAEVMADFPPLVPSLDDAGKVRLRAAAHG